MIYQREEAEQHLVVAEEYILEKTKAFYRTKHLKMILIFKCKFLYDMQCPKLNNNIKKKK